jgi:hypothetical protein
VAVKVGEVVVKVGVEYEVAMSEMEAVQNLKWQWVKMGSGSQSG